MTNKKSLKRFLTTASALGIIAIGAQEAAAAAPVAGSIYITGNAVAGNMANIMDNTGTAAAAALSAANVYSFYRAAGQEVATFGMDVDNLRFSAVRSDSAGAALGMITVARAGGGVSAAVGSIDGGAKQDFTVNGANGNTTLFLTGEIDPVGGTYNVPGANGAVVAGSAPITNPTYNGLGVITISHAQGFVSVGGTFNGATYNVINQTFARDILANGVGEGNLVVAVGSAGNIFAGNIGSDAATGNNLSTTKLYESATFKPAAGKDGILLGTTAVGLGKTITIDNTNANAAVLVKGAIESAAPAVGNTNGILSVVVGNQSLEFANNIGANNAMHSIVANVGAGGLTFKGTTKVAAGGVVLSGAGNTKFTGVVTTTNAGNFDATAATGDVTVGGALNVNGTLTTAGGMLTVNGLAKIDNAGNAVPADAVTIGAGGAEFNNGLTVTAGNLNLSADTTGTTVGANPLTMTAAGSKVKIGAGGLTAGGAITFANGGTIDVAANKLVLTGGGNVSAKADIITSKNGKGALHLGRTNPAAAANYTGAILGNIGTSSDKLNLILVEAGAAGTKATIGGANSTTTGIYTNATIFENGTKLTVDARDNSIVYTGTIDGDANDHGTLILTNNGVAGKTITVQGAIGSKFGLAAIEVQGTTTFEDTVKATAIEVKGTTTFSKAVEGKVNANALNSVTNFYGDVKGYITSANANDTINFGSGAKADITIAGGMGNAAALGDAGNAIANVNLNLGGGTLLVQTGRVNVGTLTFKTDDTLTIDAGVTGGVIVGKVVASTNNTGTINMKTPGATFDVTEDIGALGVRLKALNLGNTSTLKVAGGKNLYVNVAGAGAIVDAQGTSTFASVGTADNAIAEFKTAAGRIVTLDNLYSAKTTNAGTITLNDKGTLKLGAYAGANGIIILNDNATIVGDLGTSAAQAAALNINRITGGTVTLEGSAIGANVINQNGNILKLTKDTIVSGTTYNVTAPSTIDTNGNALHLNTQLKVRAPLVYVTTINSATKNLINVGAQAPEFDNAGNITITVAKGSRPDAGTINLFGDHANNKLHVATVAGVANNIGANQVTISYEGRLATFRYVDANAKAIADADPQLIAAQQKLAAATAAVAAAAPGAPNQATLAAAVTFAQQDLIKLQAKLGSVEGTIVVERNGTLDKAFGSTNNVSPVARGLVSDALELYNQGTITGDISTIMNNFNDLEGREVGEFVRGLSDKGTDSTMTNTQVTSTSTVTTAIQGALGSINAGNMGNASQAMNTKVSSLEGVAAGDASEKFGIWAQAMGTKATQKERKELSGFESRGGGMLVGFDTMVNDNTVVGMVASAIRNNVKFKNASSGDKADATSFIFGAYGNYDIGSTDFFVQGNLTVAQTAISSKGKKLVATGGVYQTAKAKYDVLGLGAELVGGYKYKFDTSYLAPSVGLRYNYFGDTSYTGTGLTVGNQKVETKATKIVSGLLGVKFGANVDMDGTNIMPEAHMNLSYAFNAPSTKTNFKINGLQKAYTYTGPKAARFAVNGGFSVMAEADGFEYGAGYDANISDKYLGHQGTLKVRVKL